MPNNIEDKKERNFEATVIFVVKNGKVLLGRKKEKIGAGRYNGPGGEVEQYDPSIEFRATLEMWQEIDIICADEKLRKVAACFLKNIKSDGTIFKVKLHVFLVEKRDCDGLPKPSKEMDNLKWFLQENPPFENMMAADPHILTPVFKGKKIVVRATLKNNQSELVKIKIREVKSL